jgi:hypothetical protein
MTGGPEPFLNADADADADVDADLVEYVVVGVPDTGSLDRVAAALADLVDACAIRVLDVVVLAKAGDGSMDVLEAADVDSLGTLAQSDGWYGGLLSSHDVALVSATLAPATTAVLLLAEDRWARPLARAARTAGGRLLGGERIPRSRVHASLAGAAAASVADAAPAVDREE